MCHAPAIAKTNDLLVWCWYDLGEQLESKVEKNERTYRNNRDDSLGNGSLGNHLRGRVWPFPIVNGQRTQASSNLSSRKPQVSKNDVSGIEDALY